MDDLRNVDNCLSCIVLMLISFLAGLTLAGHLSWDVLAALGTVGAVGVALFLPAKDKRHRVKALKLLISEELKRNQKIYDDAIKCFHPSAAAKIQDMMPKTQGTPVQAWQIAAAMTRNIRFDHWDSHWAEYSLLDAANYLDALEQYRKHREVKELAIKGQEDKDVGSIGLFITIMSDRCRETLKEGEESLI